MRMTFDAEARAAYITLRAGVVTDSWPLDGFIAGIDDVVLDLDAERKILGVEILGKQGQGPEAILTAIADGRVAAAMAAEGFECPRLRGNPAITLVRIA